MPSEFDPRICDPNNLPTEMGHSSLWRRIGGFFIPKRESVQRSVVSPSADQSNIPEPSFEERINAIVLRTEENKKRQLGEKDALREIEKARVEREKARESQYRLRLNNEAKRLFVLSNARGILQVVRDQWGVGDIIEDDRNITLLHSFPAAIPHYEDIFIRTKTHETQWGPETSKVYRRTFSHYSLEKRNNLVRFTADQYNLSRGSSPTRYDNLRLKYQLYQYIGSSYDQLSFHDWYQDKDRPSLNDELEEVSKHFLGDIKLESYGEEAPRIIDDKLLQSIWEFLAESIASGRVINNQPLQVEARAKEELIRLNMWRDNIDLNKLK